MNRFPSGAAAVVACATLLSACDQGTITPGESADARLAESGTILPGRYIVVLEPDAVAGKTARQVIDDVARSAAADPVYRYESTVVGFAASLSDEVARDLASDPRVRYVEPDRVMVLSPIVIEGKGKPGGGGGQPQSTPWGIDRTGGPGDGTGSVACVIDTGVDLDHPDLVVDASRGFNALTTGKDGRSLDDGNGHGTHVSGTIAARNNTSGVVGVAAGATIVPVKVLSAQGSGSYSGVIAGIDYVGSGQAGCSVANMSLGGGFSQALNDAVIAASSAASFALAAGNESTHAGTTSPASANGAGIYTVSAFSQGDLWASFSNFGNPPVDVGAPGVSVQSTYKGGGYATLSGTSMAAPHVAGLLLLGPLGFDGAVSGDPDGTPDPIAHR